MPTATLPSGESIFYTRSGNPDNPTIVLIGSIGSTHAMWNSVVPLLTDDYDVLAPDHRGHGQSSAPAGDYTTHDLASDIIALLDALDIETAEAVGLSIGGQVVLQLAHDYPERITRAVVTNTGAKIGTYESWEARASTVRAEGIEAIADGVVANWLTEPYKEEHPTVLAELRDMLTSNDNDGYAGCCMALATFDATDWLGEITVPVHAVGSTDDGPTPPALTRAIADGAHGTFTQIGGAHIPAVEIPHDYVAAIRASQTQE